MHARLWVGFGKWLEGSELLSKVLGQQHRPRAEGALLLKFWVVGNYFVRWEVAKVSLGCNVRSGHIWRVKEAASAGEH